VGEVESKDCPVCKGTNYTIKDGVKEACICVRMRRLAIYFPAVTEALAAPAQTREAILAMEFKPLTYCHIQRGLSERESHLFKLAYLLSLDCPHYREFNVYELIEIYLRQHPDFDSLFKISFPATILTEGYNEFPNVRQNDAILQYLDIVKRQRGTVLFLSRKRESDPVLLEYFERNDWQIMDLTRGRGGARAV